MVELVRAYDDGWRTMLVVAEGPKWTSLIDMGCLRHQKVETVTFRREMKPEPLDIPEERALRRLRKRRKFFRNAGASWSPIVDTLLKESAGRETAAIGRAARRERALGLHGKIMLSALKMLADDKDLSMTQARLIATTAVIQAENLLDAD